MIWKNRVPFNDLSRLLTVGGDRLRDRRPDFSLDLFFSIRRFQLNNSTDYVN